MNKKRLIVYVLLFILILGFVAFFTYRNVKDVQLAPTQTVDISEIADFDEYLNNKALRLTGDDFSLGSKYTFRIEVSEGEYVDDDFFYGEPVLISSGQAEEEGDIFGNWNLFNIRKDSYHKIEISLFDSDDNLLESDDAVVYVEDRKGLHAYLQIPSSEGEVSSLVAFNVDNNPDLELFFAISGRAGRGENVLGRLHGLKHDGSSLPGWPVVLPHTGTDSSPAVGDITNDGIAEIAVFNAGSLKVFEASGNLLFQTDDFESYGGAWFAQLSPTISDLNNDGKKEIIYGDETPIGDISMGSGRLRVLDNEGNNFDGYPISFGEDFNKVNIFGQAVGDLNNDGYKDIVFTLTAIDRPLARLVAVSGSEGDILIEQDIGSEVHSYPPVLGDIDNDGDLDIVFATFDGLEGRVYAYNGDGSLKTGWPNIINLYPVGETMAPFIPALSDVDNDGNLEIFIQSIKSGRGDSKIYAFEHNGNIIDGWPKTLSGSFRTQPIIYQIDGAGASEIISKIIIVASGNAIESVMAWHLDGSSVEGFPKQLNRDNCDSSKLSSPIIADLDNDGFLELAARSSEVDLRPNCLPNEGGREYISILKIWDLDFKSSAEEKDFWPMFGHDASRTGCYDC